MFLEIFGMGIETILCCYIADEEMFKVEDRFAEGDLAEVCRRTYEDVQKLKTKKNKAEKSEGGVEPTADGSPSPGDAAPANNGAVVVNDGAVSVI